MLACCHWLPIKACIESTTLLLNGNQAPLFLKDLNILYHCSPLCPLCLDCRLVFPRVSKSRTPSLDLEKGLPLSFKIRLQTEIGSVALGISSSQGGVWVSALQLSHLFPIRSSPAALKEQQVHSVFVNLFMSISSFLVLLPVLASLVSASGPCNHMTSFHSLYHYSVDFTCLPS